MPSVSAGSRFLGTSGGCGWGTCHRWSYQGRVRVALCQNVARTWKDSWVLWIIIGNLFRAWLDELLHCISWLGPVHGGTGQRNIRERLKTWKKWWPHPLSWAFQMLEIFLSSTQMHQILPLEQNWVKCRRVRSVWSHMLHMSATWQGRMWLLCPVVDVTSALGWRVNGEDMRKM